MTGVVRLCDSADAAHRALREAVSDAKGDDLMGRVTVLVPSQTAGVSLRRHLSREFEAAPGCSGLFDVEFTTLADLAWDLAGDSLVTAGRRRLTTEVGAEAARIAALEGPDEYRAVSGHPSTAMALFSVFRDLEGVSDQGLKALEARGARSRGLVRVFRRYRELVGGCFTEHELFIEAVRHLEAGSACLPGGVILFAPRLLSEPEAGLLRALARGDGESDSSGEGEARGDAGAARGGGALIAAIFRLTGDPDIDEVMREVAEVIGGVPIDTGAASSAPAPHAARIVAAMDPEDEIRYAIRSIAGAMDEGTRLNRMAILFATPDPYASLARDALDVAGVPACGPSSRRIQHSVAGRCALSLLDLANSGFSREAVMAFVGTLPAAVRRGRAEIPRARYERISRNAGVIGGLSQWQARLDGYRRTMLRNLENEDDDDEGGEARRAFFESEAEYAKQLREFVEELGERVKIPKAASWSAFATWLAGLLAEYLGEATDDWPGEEADALASVGSRLAALGRLDGIASLGLRPDAGAFSVALRRELDSPMRPSGRFGDGVFVGAVGDAVGVGFDRVFIVGMNEGVCPPRMREDPLLPDMLRAATGELQSLTAARRRDARHDFLAVIGGGARVQLSFCRADTGAQREQFPSAWLMESASALAGRPVFVDDLLGMPASDWYEPIASFEAGLLGAAEPASLQERDMVSILRWVHQGGPAHAHPVFQLRADGGRGVEAQLARAGSALTEWDGFVGDLAEAPLGLDRPLSPTSLETWAACPYRYFLARILEVQETVKPEETMSIDPRERGSLLHNVLEAFIREAMAVGLPAPGTGWPEERAERLSALFDSACADAEARGLTGRPLFWHIERLRLAQAIDEFLDNDAAFRAEFGTVPVHVELSFGLPDSDIGPLELELPGAGLLRFRGQIDRVDLAHDGSRAVVFDYKASRSGSRFKTTDDDPIDRGRRLQLPIYALVAKRETGAAEVSACYWILLDPKVSLIPVELDEDAFARFERALDVIAGGIRSGVFPQHPGDDDWSPAPTAHPYNSCVWCPYSSVCSQDPKPGWARKSTDPVLAGYVQLAAGAMTGGCNGVAGGASDA